MNVPLSGSNRDRPQGPRRGRAWRQTSAGAVGTFTDKDWVRAICHGIEPSGKPLLFMPSHEFYHLSDEDLGALIAFLTQVEAEESDLPETTIGPMARLLYTAGEMDLIPAEPIRHDAPRPEAPELDQFAGVKGSKFARAGFKNANITT